ncbi:MAG TPA: helix-turn-helix domain-containing protein [Anaerolineales bacterium]|nr:helix-turn-helix domain-containing protein [Anaerolineales bacterium]
MELLDSFGGWLKKRRKTLDLTQEELAGRAGCSVFALRKIESGERRPSKQLAGLLAAALEIPDEDKPTFIRVARGDLTLERMRPPSASLSGPTPAPHHLPLPSTPLLGRESELAAMAKLFNDPQCRLLTLTGMGGIGKTRLALEFAWRHKDMFSDGVTYVPLASVNSAESIVPAIAEAFAFSFSGPIEPKEQLFNFMSEGMEHAGLLVLDNLEHLIARSSAAAELVCEILQRLPCLKILTTSRERLSLHGEWMYELHGLPVPPAEFLERLDDYCAAALFIQCAQRIQPDFEITDEEKPAVVRICHMLEGIPLAIELAAAWVGMLTCREIADEIESNIDILTTTMCNIPERHRSMRATFDHSWRLLSNAERDVLHRLSVFRGFDRYAAEIIAGASLSGLASLVSKSLVRRMEDGRYDLHEVIRQYALSYLAKNQSQHDATRDQHCEHYLKFVADRETRLKSAAQQETVRELAREMDNIRVAWGWGIQRGKFESIGKAVRSFGWYFEVAGLLRDGIEQLDLLVQALSDKQRDEPIHKALGAALAHQGLLCFRSGQFIRAQGLYKNAITILRLVNEQALLADTLIFSGTLLHLNGAYPQAKALIQEGLTYAQAVNDRWFSAYGIYNLGHVDSLMGEYQKGYEQMLEGMKMWREVGDAHVISLGLNFLVDTQIALGRYEEAKTSMWESITLCEQAKNRWGMGTAYRYLGLATLAEGQFVEAQGYFRKSLDIFGECSEGWDIARTLIYLGEATLMSGELVESENIYQESLRVAKEAASTPLMLDALAGLAELNKQTGNFERALEHSLLISNHAACSQETRDRVRRIIETIENRLDPQRIHTINERVSTLSLEAHMNTIIL